MSTETDDLDLKLAIASGMGLTVEDAADLSGCSTGTYYNRTAKNGAFFDKWRSFTTLAASKRLAAEVTKVRVAQKAEDKLTDRLDRALQISDRAMAKLEEMGDTASLKELLAGHKILTEFFADFAASRAPKRVQLEGEVQHTHKVIPPAFVQRLARFSVKNAKYLPPADAVEAEVVS